MSKLFTIFPHNYIECSNATSPTKIKYLDVGDYFSDEPDSEIIQISDIRVETRSGMKVYRITFVDNTTLYYDPTDIVYLHEEPRNNPKKSQSKPKKSIVFSKINTISAPCKCYVIKGLPSYGRNNYLCTGNEWHEFGARNMIVYLDRKSAINVYNRVENCHVIECLLNTRHELTPYTFVM